MLFKNQKIGTQEEKPPEGYKELPVMDKEAVERELQKIVQLLTQIDSYSGNEVRRHDYIKNIEQEMYVHYRKARNRGACMKDLEKTTGSANARIFENKYMAEIPPAVPQYWGPK